MKKFSITKIIILILSVISLSLCDNTNSPGVRLVISDSGIKMIENVIIPKYLNEKKFPLADQILPAQHIDFLGTIHLNVTNNYFAFHNMTGDNIQVQFVEPSSVNVNLNNLAGSIDFSYSFHSGFYDSVGPGYVNMTNMVVQLKSKLSAQPNALEPEKLSPGLEVTDLELVSVTMDIQFGKMGDLEKLLKYFVLTLQDTFINLVRQELLKAIPQINLVLKYALTTIPLEVNINSTDLTLDYSLVSAPTVSDHLLEISLNSSISSKVNNISYSGPAKPLPHITNSSTTEFFTGLINQYVLDSLSYTLFKEDKANIYINSDNITLLTTSTLALAIPELYEHYGAKPVDINLKALQFPQINLKENTTLLKLNYDADFIVRLNGTNNTHETAFTANATLSVDLNLMMIKGLASGKLNKISIDEFKITKSSIGPIDDSNLAENLNNIITQFLGVIDQYFAKLIETIKIPDFGEVSFNKTTFVTHEGYIELETTPIFKETGVDNGHNTEPMLSTFEEPNERSALTFLGKLF